MKIFLLILISSCGYDCDFYRGTLCVDEGELSINHGLLNFAIRTTESIVNVEYPKLNIDSLYDGVKLEIVRDGYDAHIIDFSTIKVGWIDQCSWNYQSIAHESLHLIAKKHIGVSNKDNKNHWEGHNFFNPNIQGSPMSIEYLIQAFVVKECERIYGE